MEDESDTYDSIVDSFAATSTTAALEYENEFDSEVSGSDEDVDMPPPLVSPVSSEARERRHTTYLRLTGEDIKIQWIFQVPS